MICSTLDLARRLEALEAFGCVSFAQARLRHFPACGSEWHRIGEACLVFDGVDSPITQTFGLGVLCPLNAEVLDEAEAFFLQHRAPVMHEISPLVGVEALDLLCRRGYRPVEISSVMYQELAQQTATPGNPDIQVRVAEFAEIDLWTGLSVRGWCHEHPELHDFLAGISRISFAKEGNVSFLAERNGFPGAAGALCIKDGAALFAGAATVPEMRRNGLQNALVAARLQYARAQGCDFAMMVAEVGSESQRNAERNGFQIAYTRMKWKLSA